MSRRYDQLAVTALRLVPDEGCEREYHLLRFPGKWKRPLRRLAQSRRGGEAASIPIASLNDAIAALVPDSVVTLKYAGAGDADQDWLLAYNQINTRAIFNLVAAWVRSQKATPDQVASVLGELDPGQLTWSTVTVDFSSPEQRRLAMRLLPMEIAATLSAPSAVCPHGGLSFRRCTAEDGAELISWPPLRVDEQTPFSVRLGITAQTLPTSDEPFAYLTFGVRRWVATRPVLAFDHGHNVYLAPSVPYLKDAEHSRHFGRARIQLSRDTDPDGKTVYLPQWDDPLARVLHQAGCLSKLPDPQQLTRRPLEYLLQDGGAAALVYGTGMLSPGQTEKVSAGLPLGDREPLMDWVVENLAPVLRPVTPLPRTAVKVYRALGKAAGAGTPAAALAQAIHDLVGPRLDIELYTDTTEATSYALDALSARLGANLPSAGQLTDQPTTVDIGALTVGICRPTPRIAADLETKNNGNRGEALSASVAARVAEIEEYVPSAGNATLTLVEIAGQDAYRGARRRADPKFAVRHGLVRTGRLSQFVTPVTVPARPPRPRKDREPSDANAERFADAIDDLFRQLGVRPQPLPQPAPNTVERRPALLAVWLIRKNKRRTWGVTRQVPVAVLIDPTGMHIHVRAPEVDWQPLHTGLIEIGRRYVDVTLRCGPEDVTRFIKEVVSETVATYPDTLLLTHAQNLRGAWNAINNTQVQLDSINFGGEPEPIAKFPGLRHVRVRTSDGGETPQCYGVADDDTGQPQGLWQFLLPRLYGSTAAKPATATGALMHISKIAPYAYKETDLDPNPRKQVWNPQLVELFVAAVQDGDRPEVWAALAHDLRRAAPYVKDTTILPWPLHLATQIEEYLLPTAINHPQDSASTE
jgi:hypothetical protein